MSTDDRLITFLNEKIDDVKGDLGGRIDGVNSRLDRICARPEACREQFASKQSLRKLVGAVGILALLEFTLHGGRVFVEALAEVARMVK